MTKATHDSLEMALVHLRDAFGKTTQADDHVQGSILKNVIDIVQGLLNDGIGETKQRNEQEAHPRD